MLLLNKKRSQGPPKTFKPPPSSGKKSYLISNFNLHVGTIAIVLPTPTLLL